MSLSITPIRALRDNYVWLIERAGGRDAVVVDPGEARPVAEELARRKLRLAAILVTHHHYDHVGGIAGLIERYPARVVGPAHEHIPERDVGVADGDVVDIPELDISLCAMAVPGHTLGAISYIGNGFAFTGDTLFTAGCGRLFEGTAAQMHGSLARLAALPEDARVYCGHEYTLANLRFAAAVEPHSGAIARRMQVTEALYRGGQPAVPASIATERATNPFLRCDVAEVRRAAQRHCGRTLDNAVDVFAVLRAWKDSFR